MLACWMQTLLFSATMPSALHEFAKAGLRDPEMVRLDVESRISPDLGLAFFSVRCATVRLLSGRRPTLSDGWHRVPLWPTCTAYLPEHEVAHCPTSDLPDALLTRPCC